VRPGKLTARDLQERVFPHLGHRDDVLVHATVGQDCAILDFGPTVCVVTTDPITGAGKHLGRLAVHVACNDLATTGAEPVGLLLTLLLAGETAGADLEHIVREAGAAARTIGVEIVGGHTEVTPGIDRPIVVVSAIGRAPHDRYVSAGGGRPGDALLLTKSAGIEGTAILATDLASRMRGMVDEDTLARARTFIDRISVVPEGRIGARCAATAMHDVTEGGVLTGVWELADASRCGLRLDADAVPVAPETQAICVALDADPLALISSGAMLIGVANPGPMQAELEAAGINSAVIGTLTERERLVIRGGRTLDLVPPDRDELWRLLEAARVGG
jgi:hydrogenase expression/formation protein HypE